MPNYKIVEVQWSFQAIHAEGDQPKYEEHYIYSWSRSRSASRRNKDRARNNFPAMNFWTPPINGMEPGRHKYCFGVNEKITFSSSTN